jgi:eukaryotic-like serine/threonine-protein kinase
VSAPTAATETELIGETIGPWRVFKQIGEGGMGAVYLAEHHLIGRKAAIKVLQPEFSRNEEIMRRFFNEARSSALIKNPGIVDILDLGSLPNGSAYIVMEYLEGESLTARTRRGRMPMRHVAEIARQIAATLGAAHAAGIIHRDLKPDNLYIVKDPEVPGGERVKILDFGIAKLGTELKGAPATRSGQVMGTPAYMSPEQCRSTTDVDHRADIYSIGCLLFEMVCGRRVFEGTNPEVIGAQIHEEPPRPSSFHAKIPPDLEATILKALAKNPAHRHQSMAELAAELEPAAQGRAPRRAIAGAHAGLAAKRNKVLLLVAVGLGLAAVGAAILGFASM